MTDYLLDTGTCIYWLKGTPSVKERLLTVDLTNLAISAITVAELYFGAYNSTKIEQNIARLADFFRPLRIISPESNSLETFGRIKAKLRKQGEPLADFDLLIASTAMATNRTLVTNNIQHYSRITNLELENWYTTQPS